MYDAHKPIYSHPSARYIFLTKVYNNWLLFCVLEISRKQKLDHFDMYFKLITRLCVYACVSVCEWERDGVGEVGQKGWVIK